MIKEFISSHIIFCTRKLYKTLNITFNKKATEPNLLGMLISMCIQLYKSQTKKIGKNS